MRSKKPFRALGLALAASLLVGGLFASGASAHAKSHMSKAQRARISKQLMRDLKRSHGRVISKHWFLKKASQVDWQLPVTIRLLPAIDQNHHSVSNAQTTVTSYSGTTLTVGDASGFVNNQPVFVFYPSGPSWDSATVVSITGNTLTLNAPLAHAHSSPDAVSSMPGGANQATLDLGPSLGKRTLGLGGFIRAVIDFSNAFDGGQLGNVTLSLDSGAGQSGVTTTSVPLLSNSNTDTNTATSAPQNALYSFIVNQNDPNSASFYFNGHAGSPSAAVPVSQIYGDTRNGGGTGEQTHLEASFASVQNPNNTAFNVGSSGIYAYGVNIPSTTLVEVTVVFTGPQFNGTALPGLVDNGTATVIDPSTHLPGNPFQNVAGNPPGLDQYGQGGCHAFAGNGTGNDVDLANRLNTSLNPGGVDNVGPGPSYGGDSLAGPRDVVLRTGPLTATVASPSNSVVIPADNSLGIAGGGGTSTITVGPSGGVANLFGTPVNGLGGSGGGANTVDVTANLTTNINDIERQVDGAFPAPAGAGGETSGNIAAYDNCRQAWTGAITDYLTNIHLVGNLRISPAVTADGNLRLAKTYLHSQYPTTEALAACLAPYQLYMQANPFSGDTFAAVDAAPNLLQPGGIFDPLAVLFGSALGAPPTFAGAATPATPLPGGTSATNTASGVSCDSTGPLNRPPFGVSNLGSTGLVNNLTDGAAVAVTGALDVTNLNAEVLVGNI